MEKDDKFVLDGVLQVFNQNTNAGRIYPTETYIKEWERLIYEEKIKKRKIKIKKLLEDYDKEGN